MTEQWKTIEGWLDYEVSDLGRVRSWKYRHPRILKPDEGGRYALITLQRNGKKLHTYIHILVLTAFVGPSDGMQCAHGQNNRLNNKLENLRWIF